MNVEEFRDYCLSLSQLQKLRRRNTEMGFELSGEVLGMLEA